MPRARKSSVEVIEDSQLRGRVYVKLNVSRVWLLNYLGHPNMHTMIRSFSAEDKRKCEVLAGPNGCTIYKMILLKREQSKHAD